MTQKNLRRLLLVLITLSVLSPIVMVALQKWQPVTVIIGLAVAALLGRILSVMAAEAAIQANEKVWQKGPETGRTIYVQLVDDRGALLPKDEQERRMAEAHREAGPRDTVVPVKRASRTKN